MYVSLELTIEADRMETDVYRLCEVERGDGSQALQVTYECDDNILYPEGESGARVPGNWEITGVDVDVFEEKLAMISVQACPEFRMGLDGKMTTLVIERGFNRVEFRWWEELPREWEALQEVLNVVLRQG